MYWRGFGVLCVVGAKLITLGCASLSSAGNGTKITSGNGAGLGCVERGSVGPGDGRSLRFGTEVGEVGELVRTSRVEEEVKTAKEGEEWSISTMMGEEKREVTTGKTEVYTETKVNLVSTCVPISTTKEGGRTSSDSSSITLLISSTRASKICGWMASTSTTTSSTVSATDAVKIGNALLASTERRSTSTRGMGPSTTLSKTRTSRGNEESTTVQLTNQRTSASTSTRSIQTTKHPSTANMSKHGSPSTSFKTPATTTRSVASAVPSMSSTADEMAQRKNSTLVFDLEDEHLKEDSGLVRNGNVAMAQDDGNGTTTSLDEEAQVRSNGTKTEFREDGMTEAPKTSALTVVSSSATISDAIAVESGNITSSEGLENEEQRPVRNNGTAYELESYGDANTVSPEFQAAIPTKSTISEATILSSSNQTLANIDSEAQTSNLTEAFVASVDGSASSSDVPETSSPQNITTDSAPMMPNATLPVATELLAESTTNITSSIVLSALSETVPKKDAMSNTTLIGSAPSATNATFNLVFPAISAANSSSAALKNTHDAAHLDGLGNNSSFRPGNHSTDILGILAGNSTPPPLSSTGAGALVVFALLSNQSNALNSGSNNCSITEIGDLSNITEAEMENSAALPDPESVLADSMLNQTNITILGDPSIPLNDTKLRVYDTLYRVHETAMSTFDQNDTVNNGNTSSFGTVEIDTLIILNSTTLILPMSSNETAITVYGNHTAPLMSLAFVGLNESVIMNATSLSTIETDMAANSTTINKGMKPNHESTVLLNDINSTDLADAQVRRYIQRLGNALHMSEDNLKNVVCTYESLMNDMATLSRDEFDLVGQACFKLWENHAELGANETTGVSAVKVIANVAESIVLESSPSNATAADKLEDYPSLANFTESDGNAPERLGPTRTSTTALPTGLISMTLSSRMEPATEISTRTSSLTMSTFSTSFTSASTSSNSKTTSTSSSMRPKMTACVDDFNFFEMTDANLDESGTIAWYMNWTAISAAQDGKFNSLGEVRYFGQAWLKDPDYDCGLEHGGCTRRPSCNSILSLYPDDEELARRIYFVMKMHSTINTVMKSYYDAIQLTHQNVAAQIHTIISTTMQTPHFDDAAACKFLQTSYSNIQTIIIDLYEPRTTMEGKGWNDPWFVDELKYTTPSAQGIWWLQYPDPITHKEKGMTKWVHGRLMMLYKMWFKDSIGRMDASMKLCDGLGIVNQDKAGTEEKLKLALSQFSTYQRKELSKHVQELNNGKFYGEGDPSVLSSMLTMGIWNNEEAPRSALNVLRDPYQLEEMMTKQTKEGILSQSYIQQKCYMKCTSHPHAALLCKGFNDWEFSTKHALKHGGTPADSNYYGHAGPMSGLSEAEKNMRICPEPNKVCQVECWSQEKKGWSMPLHGVNNLSKEPLGVDIQQKMKEIYAYYKENGNASPYDQPQDPAKDMEANMSDLPKPGPPPKGPHFWLPVCDSDQGYTHIVDFGQQRHSKYNLKQHSRGLDQRSFPVSCGSFRSDQTVEFMEAMGLTNHHSRDVSWTMDPFFQNYAALNLAVLIEAPLDNFLAFCALGIAYPQNDLMDSRHGEMGISRKGSRWCEPIAQETEGMGWYMANLWFCRKSPSARQLFKSQGMSGAIVGLHKIKNHKQLCRRWLATAQGEQMGGLDGIDGSQSKNRKIGAEAIGFPNKIDAYGDRSRKGGKHGHAPVTEAGGSKGWFDVMNGKEGNGRRDVGAGDKKEGVESGRAIKQAEEAAKRTDEEVGEDMKIEVDMVEARREEEAYWKEFAALKFDEEDDE